MQNSEPFILSLRHSHPWPLQVEELSMRMRPNDKMNGSLFLLFNVIFASTDRYGGLKSASIFNEPMAYP